jgi:hypothetical protein
MTLLGLASAKSEVVFDMQERFGPGNVFSVMVPANWDSASTEDRFIYSAPNNGPSLQGSAFRITRRPPLKEFSDARFEGVLQMGVYQQVGKERPLAPNSGVVREYEGVWPGEKELTYYVVACNSAGDAYAAVALVTSKADFIKNRVFYEKMLSTFTVRNTQ